MATIYGTSANDDLLNGTDAAETIYGLEGADDMSAGSGNDALYGGDGNDALNGQDGNDVMLGGAGDDNYYVHQASDKVYETVSTSSKTDAGGMDLVISTASWTLGNYVENLMLDGTDNINGTGNKLNNQMLGNSGNNILSGGDGSDQLNGGDGNDTLIGGTGLDYLGGGSGDDTYVVDQADERDYITENAGEGDNDTLKIAYSNGAADAVTIALTGTLAGIEHVTLTGTGKFNLTGNAAANILTGNASANVMSGGGNNDTYYVGKYDTTIEQHGEGTDKVMSSLSWTLGDNIENLTLTGKEKINGAGNALDNFITGNAANNVLTGGDGDDELDGGSGSDTMIGGAGNDFYHVNASTDKVEELAGGGGSDIVYASVSYSLAGKENLEHVWLSGLASINATGNGLNNNLQGNAGNNVLDGGAGADTMYGGAGNDTFVVDDSGDVVQELAADGDGIDLVKSSVTYTLGGNVENLTLTGGSIGGTGNALANVLTGSDLDNNLYGAAGNDTLRGGGGNDHLYGETGDDSLDGGAGNDFLAGGGGNDIYVWGAGDMLAENALEGNDTILSAVTLSLTDFSNIENITLTGTAAVNATGDGGNNRLVGNGGKNVLTGLGGNDTYVWKSGDTIVEADSGGAGDTIESDVSLSLVNFRTIENLTLTGTGNISATGNDSGNTLIGNPGNNILNGGAWADTMNGAGGSDVYLVGNNIEYGGDSIADSGSNGIDEIRYPATAVGEFKLTSAVSGVERIVIGTGTGAAAVTTGTAAIDLDASALAYGLTLIGNSGDNTIKGGAGNDTLIGGKGVDTFYGGAGDDTYVLDRADEEAKIHENDGNDTVVIAYSNLSSTPVLWDIQLSFLENITVTGTGKFNLYGNWDSNVLTGNSSANVMKGGDGSDTYVVGNKEDAVIEWAGDTGTDEVVSSINYSLVDTDGAGDNGGNVENLTLIGTSNLYGIGNALANTMTGNSGNNRLEGGANDDVLYGEKGNDELYGEEGADDLCGGDGNDTLDGGSGDDYMLGGKGNDVYFFDSPFESLVELANEGTDTIRSSLNWSLAGFSFANVEHLTLTGTGDFSATGNALNNVLTGNIGDNVLNGGLGNDTMWGGSGDDFYYVDSVLDKVYESKSATNTADAGGTADEVFSTVHWTLGNHVENLTLTGTGNFEGKGNSLANIITGNAGNNNLLGEGGDDRLYGYAGHDRLDGGAGSDTMEGGAGDDIYFVNAVGDTITEALDRGNDTVYASISYALVGNIENLTLTGTGNINATGNELDNVLTGNGGKNKLTGGAGNDTYVWGTGDTLAEETGGGNQDVILSGVTLSLASFANIENLTLTGTANVNATGNALNNTLIGNAGNNRLDGGAGIDTLTGGKGNDTYVVTAGDSVVEDTSEGTDTVESATTWTLGGDIENLTLTGSVAISGTGNIQANIIRGDTNTAANTLDGGAGDDIYYLGTEDTVVEIGSGGTDTVYAGFSYSLIDTDGVGLNGGNVENLTLTGTANIDGTGNSLANVLIGNSGKNRLTGGDGNDTYYITSGDTVIEGSTLDAGTDTVYAGFSYTLVDNVEKLVLTGASAINGTGNGLDNTITGNGAANRLIGGAGHDAYYVGKGDTVVENADEGYDKIYAGVSYTLPANVEMLELTGTANINATGNAGSNHIWSNAGKNIMKGGAGSDYYYNVDAADTVVENADVGTDEINTAISWTLGANIENLKLTGSDSVNGTGNALNNTLIGNAGNNRLDGGAGSDTMTGGAGNDTYVWGSGDTLVEEAGGGNDTILSDTTLTLAIFSNIENLTLTGTADIRADGNGFNNVITGNDGANILNGGAGDDTYYIGAGDAVIEGLGAGIDTVHAGFSYTLADNVEKLVLTGTSLIDGTGNALNNDIWGNGSNNRLDGGLGNDTLRGGAGNDTYYVDSGDTVIESMGEGIDTLHAGFSYTLTVNFENLTLTGIGNFAGTGNAGNNVVTGNSGNNMLIDGAGADTLYGGAGDDSLSGGLDGAVDSLIGGAGNDVYYVDEITDIVDEGVSAGTDIVVTSYLSYYTLGANVENLTHGGAAKNFSGFGNALNNTMYGNANSHDVLYGQAGNDTLYGGSGDDLLMGDEGSDTLNGDEGNDDLYGGTGMDILNGGAGADKFYFNMPLDGATNVDTIQDFAVGVDKIYLDHTIFTSLQTGVLSSAYFMEDSSSWGDQDYILYDQASGRLWYDGDGTGSDYDQTLFATLIGSPNLQASDIVVV